MITYVNGDLFASPAQVLVNTVNTVGVMGKGIAYKFKRIYPSMFATYRHYCETKQLTIGKLYLHRTPHKWILNFPTKAHWRHPSRPDYIASGLRTFKRTFSSMRITSIVFPALGCGNGELDFNRQVRPIMEEHLSPLSIPVFLYPPRPSTAPPEHRDIRHIATWLRSQPATLPFDEVWRDLSSIILKANTFTTIPNDVPYTAELVSPPHGPEPALMVTVRTRRYRYDRETLLDFWQQLRDYGFVHRSIAPRHHRVSYLIPIFERLPYVQRVAVSDSPKGLDTRPAVGLHVVPPPRPEGGIFAAHQYELAEV